MITGEYPLTVYSPEIFGKEICQIRKGLDRLGDFPYNKVVPTKKYEQESQRSEIA